MSGAKAPVAKAPSARASSAKAPRVWQRMLSGRRLDLLDPSPLDVEIEDIAHGLARVARWNGQTSGEHAFSVAQHSLIVEAVVSATETDPRWRMAALLHDGPEYVIGDMISPFKSVMGGDYKLVEQRLQSAIHRRFGLPAELPKQVEKVIKAADRLSAYREATLLAGFKPAEAAAFFGAPTSDVVDAAVFTPWPAGEVGRLFIARFEELDRLLHPATPSASKKTTESLA